MQLTALVSLALAVAGPASASSALQPRAVGVIQRALSQSYPPVQAQKRQEHSHDHFDVVFPQVCAPTCQRMIQIATDMESAAYQAQATERVGSQIGPDLDDDRISDSVRNDICTTDNVRDILDCVNCAYGNGVPNLSEDDAEDVIDWFEDFCDDTQAWEALDDDDDDDVTVSRTATGPFTTVTNVHLPVGFTDYPQQVASRASGAAPSSGSPGPTGSPTTPPSPSRSAPQAATSSPNAAAHADMPGAGALAAVAFAAGLLI